MTDDVKALIAEADEYDDALVGGEDENWLALVDLVRRMRDALEAATVAPAVDRKALANVIEVASGKAFLNGARGQLELSLASADAVIAHLGARDVRDVQAEALEQAAVAIRPIGPQDDWTDYATGIARGADLLELRAQAIREARNER